MKNKIMNEILPLVQKPGRYIGNEVGAIHKDHRDRIKFCLCFPDLYEIGMSNLGLQIIYHRINRHNDALCERAFCAAPDLEQLLIEHNIPLWSLETFTPLKDFDFLGFSVGYEIAYCGVLDILDLAKIPLSCSSRKEDDPIVITGGPAILNPEPLVDFIDVFFLGDGEEAADEIIAIARTNEYKTNNRRGRLRLLSSISGSYVPSFYKISPGSAGLKPMETGIAEVIKIRSVLPLKNEYYPALPIIPNIETVHDRLSIEIMRGCPRGCRFCQAGYQYRPRRERVIDDIIKQIDESLEHTGYEEISLLSLSTTDYSGLEKLLSRLNSSLNQNRTSIAIPSFRPGTISMNILNALNNGRKTGLTFAPEAGTQKLRDVINKDITEEEILSTSVTAFAHGWDNIKLYFMIGLPTETEEDIDGIINLIRKVEEAARQYGRRKKIGVTISPFVPKPMTPFQWERQIGLEEILSKYRMLQRGLKSKIIDLRFHHAESSIVEGVLSRSDRNIGNVLIAIHNSGLRLQAWSEYFDYERWLQAFEKCGFDFHRVLAGFAAEDHLPWSHITKGISEKFFEQEKIRAYNAEPLRKRHLGSNEMPTNQELPEGESLQVYGRQKRVVRKGPQIQIPSSTIRIRWLRDDSMRFLGHRDMMRIFQRAVSRAGMPVGYSQGFSPHQRISFGPPLPVGYTSEDEYLDIHLSAPFQLEMLERLRKALPQGIEVHHIIARHGFMESLSELINLQEYIITIPDGVKEWTLDGHRPTLTVEREKNGQMKELDIAPGLFEIEKVHRNRLRLMIRAHIPGVGRPEEYMTLLAGLDKASIRTSHYHRIKQYHLENDIRSSIFEASN